MLRQSVELKEVTLMNAEHTVGTMVDLISIIYADCAWNAGTCYTKYVFKIPHSKVMTNFI